MKRKSGVSMGFEIYRLHPSRGKVVVLTLQASRFFSFIPVRNKSFAVAGAVELWVTRSVIQAPGRQPGGLSIRRGKSIGLKGMCRTIQSEVTRQNGVLSFISLFYWKGMWPRSRRRPLSATQH